MAKETVIDISSSTMFMAMDNQFVALLDKKLFKDIERLKPLSMRLDQEGPTLTITVQLKQDSIKLVFTAKDNVIAAFSELLKQAGNSLLVAARSIIETDTYVKVEGFRITTENIHLDPNFSYTPVDSQPALGN